MSTIKRLLDNPWFTEQQERRAGVKPEHNRGPSAPQESRMEMEAKNTAELSAPATEAPPLAPAPEVPDTSAKPPEDFKLSKAQEKSRAQVPSAGRIVHYRLTEQDADGINGRRDLNRRMLDGNLARAGDVVPMTVVRCWDRHPSDYVPGKSLLNGQATLDGNDAWWVTSVAEGEGPGTWSWPARVG